MSRFLQALGLALMLTHGVSALAAERCMPGVTRCIPSPVPAPAFDASYICRATSYSGYGYPASYQVGGQYICQDLGYGYDSRFWPGGNHTGRYVCCYDPYAR